MMKNKFLILPILILINLLPIRLFAQKAPMKLGDVKEEWIKTTTYEKNMDEEAVVLCDYGHFSYDKVIYSDKASTSYEVKKRIKIFKKSALHKGIFLIHYTHNFQKIVGIKANIYNYVNGKIEKTKLDKSGIFEKKINKNITEAKITLPNIKEGTLFEYEYEIVSTYGRYIPTWFFQDDIPIEWSEFRSEVPNIFLFQKFPQTDQPFHIKEEETFNDQIIFNNEGHINVIITKNRWVQKNVPAFKDEPFIASKKDHLIKLEYRYIGSEINKIYTQHTNTWTKFIFALQNEKTFGGYINDKKDIKKKLPEILVDKFTPKEKMFAIYEYIKMNITCNGTYDFTTNQSPKVTLEKKIGSVADVNLLLLSMLQEAQINAFPVLISTRGNGKINIGFPSEDDINYVAVFVEFSLEETYLFDATDPMYVPDMLNPDAINGAGLIVYSPQKYEWLPLQKRKFTKSNVVLLENMKIEANGNIKGTGNIKIIGYEAVIRRKNMQEVKTEKSNENKKDAYINKFIYKNVKDYNKPLEGERNIDANDLTQINADLIYFLPLLDYTEKINPFKQEYRKFDIDFTYPREITYNMIYQIPEGYKVDELPKNLKIKSPDGGVKYDFLIQVNSENKIQVMSKMAINNALFSAKEYKGLKDFYAQIVAKQQEQVVLKKK